MDLFFISLGVLAIAFDLILLYIIAGQLRDAYEYVLRSDLFLLIAYLFGILANASLVFYFVFLPLFSHV